MQKIYTRISKMLISIMIMTFMPFAFFNVYAEEVKTNSTTTGFNDVSRSHPYYVAITYLNQTEVIKGYADNTFKPEKSINRAEALKIILKGSNIEAPEEFEKTYFVDIKKTDWFTRYIVKAKELDIVQGNQDGSFSPARQVNKAEIVKMLLIANKVKVDVDLSNSFTDVPQEAWFAPYMLYATDLGIISQNNNMLEPGKLLTRGEVAEIIYLLTVIQKGKETQFLLSRAEAELAQIEVYIAANRSDLAKKASELAVDLTQQTLKNTPEDNIVLGEAKLARAYDYLVDAFIFGIQKKNTEAAEWANKAIKKANEAWEVNNATQQIARHIKDRAREILEQVDGEEIMN